MNISKNEMMNQFQNNINLSVKGKDGSIHLLTNNEKKNQNSDSSFYGGNLNLAENRYEIGTKQAQAQKKALKDVFKQFTKDLGTDDTISQCQQKGEELSAESVAAQNEIDKLGDLRQQLKESFNIEDDSEEQKNLELLQRSMKDPISLTNDEWEKLENMGPLTEYQKSALEYDSMEEMWQKKSTDANNETAALNGMVEGIKLALLKVHPMVDAQVEAAKIMEEAAKEVISTIVQDTKDSIDDEVEKKKEEAEKQTEEKKEEEEQVNKDQNTNQTASDESVSEIPETDTEQDKMQTEIKIMINKLKMNEDDTKGLAVDEQV